ncbi:hypothetical protein EXIGLDRAFT_53391 [Exidia glandulosa HHB12029]|uniref:Uncharacterized protein n=1 Tax=Exidia glandulosa HHB12029 TaxID=1314781 RepID=A0A165IC60_EXIGL|nr:hypothetical protein EXIGLDRAFT_53391 [Exidia glandulosa HHB12029]
MRALFRARGGRTQNSAPIPPQSRTMHEAGPWRAVGAAGPPVRLLETHIVRLLPRRTSLPHYPMRRCKLRRMNHFLCLQFGRGRCNISDFGDVRCTSRVRPPTAPTPTLVDSQTLWQSSPPCTMRAVWRIRARTRLARSPARVRESRRDTSPSVSTDRRACVYLVNGNQTRKYVLFITLQASGS